MNYEIAEANELPSYFCLQLLGKPVGFLITSILSLLLVNTVNLESISTAGSSGFLLIFAIVNYIGFKKHKELNSKKSIHLIGSFLCAIAFVALIAQQSTSNIQGVAISLGIIAFCFIFEYVFQKINSTKAGTE